MKLISEKHPVVVCFLLVLIAYLPIVSFQFAIKNDFFSAYFPLKYFLSESIHAGSFPTWNPYLNYGFPVYGDMSEAYWNPLTWLIAATVGYNPWTFTIEIMLYIFLACWSMYHLGGLWMKETWTRQLAAIAFACSGFFIGHLQHFNWITGAALLPLCLVAIIKFTTSGKLKYFLATVLGFSWFLTSAHPGIIIGMILFLIPLLIHLQLFHRKQLLRIGVAALAVLAACSGMLYAYLEVLPFTNRSQPVGALVTPALSTGLRSWVSVLMSMPITKADAFFGNDIAMRNCFFGMLLLASMVMIFSGKLKGTALYFACCGLGFLVLSSELILPLYSWIPLVNFVRLNSEFRIFAILSFIIAGGISLEYAMKWKTTTLLRSLQAFRYLYGAAAASALIYILVRGSSFIAGPGERSTLRSGIKAMIADLSFADTVFLHASIQLVFCSLLIIALKKQDHRKLLFTGCAEIILAALLNMPFTGVGQRSVKDIDQLLSKAPKGIIAPRMLREDEVVSEYPKTDLILGNWSLYSKQIAMDSLFPYPLMFSTTLEYAQSEQKNALMLKPPFFLKSPLQIPGNQLQYSFQKIAFQFDLLHPDTLVIKQNIYPHWRAEIDGDQVPILTAASTFISLPLPAGKHIVVFEFSNNRIKILLLSEFVLLLITAIALLVTWRDQRIRYIFP